MQRLTPQVIGQLDNLPGFPPAPTSSPPLPNEFILGTYLEEIRVRPGVLNLAQLPLTGNTTGDVRVVVGLQAWYFWDGAAWIPITGGGGGGGNPEITGQVTAGLVAGEICYLSAANTWSAAAADGPLLQAQSLGAYLGVAGTVALSGSVVAAVRCTTAGGAPAINGRLYLAPASEDGGTGAGKVTATPPTPPLSGTVNLQYIGACVDNSLYAGAKTVKAVFQPSFPVVLVG